LMTVSGAVNGNELDSISFDLLDSGTIRTWVGEASAALRPTRRPSAPPRPAPGTSTPPSPQTPRSPPSTPWVGRWPRALRPPDTVLAVRQPRRGVRSPHPRSP